MGVDVDGVDDIIADLDDFPDEMREEVADGLNRAALRVEEIAREVYTTNGTNETNTLRSSIAIRKTATGEDLEAVTGAGGKGEWGNAEYVGVVEFGSKPHFPPIEALTGDVEALDRWVERTDKVTVGSDEDRESVAFAVAKKIAQRGNRAQPFMRPARNRVQRNMPEVMEVDLDI